MLRRPLESAQYASEPYRTVLERHGITQSMSRRGPWRALDDVELATLEYVDWFNHRRLHGACGNIPPVEFEDDYYRQIAGLTQDVPAEPSLH